MQHSAAQTHVYSYAVLAVKIERQTVAPLPSTDNAFYLYTAVRSICVYCEPMSGECRKPKPLTTDKPP